MNIFESKDFMGYYEQAIEENIPETEIMARWSNQKFNEWLLKQHKVSGIFSNSNWYDEAYSLKSPPDMQKTNYLVVYLDENDLRRESFGSEEEAKAFIESIEWKAYLIEGNFLESHT